MSTRPTPPGGGHTADSETVRKAIAWGQTNSEWVQSPDALAALARLEAAANRTAALLESEAEWQRRGDRAIAAEAERDEWKAAFEAIESCDCVSAMFSSKACQKCGRRGAETKETMEAAVVRGNRAEAERDAALKERDETQEALEYCRDELLIEASGQRDAAHAALRPLVDAVNLIMEEKPGELLPDGRRQIGILPALTAMQKAIGPARAVLGGPEEPPDLKAD